MHSSHSLDMKPAWAEKQQAATMIRVLELCWRHSFGFQNKQSFVFQVILATKINTRVKWYSCPSLKSDI